MHIVSIGTQGRHRSPTPSSMSTQGRHPHAFSFGLIIQKRQAVRTRGILRTSGSQGRPILSKYTPWDKGG